MQLSLQIQNAAYYVCAFYVFMSDFHATWTPKEAVYVYMATIPLQYSSQPAWCAIDVIHNVQALSPCHQLMPVPGNGDIVSDAWGSAARGRLYMLDLKTSPTPVHYTLQLLPLDNRLDYIWLQWTTWCEFRDCRIFFIKTWLSDRVTDGDIRKKCSCLC